MPADVDEHGSEGTQLTIAELVAMPHLGLELVAGAGGADRVVLWTHTSELEDPGPWLEGGELLIVNGFGVPDRPDGQVRYLRRLAEHRLAGIAVSVRAPELTPELLAEADRLEFPVLKIPRATPFIELSYLVAGVSARSARSRLSRHLRIFETLRLRNDGRTPIAEIYTQLEAITGYRLAVLTPAGLPLIADWDWVPDDLDLAHYSGLTELQMVPGGYLLPLAVGDRVSAYLVAMEHPDAEPEGLAALQHVSSLAYLDALDDQRRREAEHRQRSVLFAQTLESEHVTDELEQRYAQLGFLADDEKRVLAFAPIDDRDRVEIEARDWLTDRSIPYLMLARDDLTAILACSDAEIEQLAHGIGLTIGASNRFVHMAELRQRQRQARWTLAVADGTGDIRMAVAESTPGILQWLHPDKLVVERLAYDTLRPLIEHDAANGSELVHTLAVYFECQGKLRMTAAQLFLHEHTLAYRIKKIEQITRRNLKAYSDSFELWLAVQANALR
ncbi:PucR family transcriptional regulator [Gulosibacter sp. ACHW.36C]|uniref:PucR family transcriptional regulator ligand-binding domain-containing protein n=1 Tax=Gulosibacter sediminis TaxID=1729695 RepID=A0ABY4N1E5_9MICO|nr:PucR family transcriptional regulator [Gulosibacter sediminis]UQN15058.1 PucR family transcriptional regulator ligand-binding domain-containing protein [Gulosibacter sediminis]